MSAEEYAKLPETILVRELRYKLLNPGYRVREVTLATTLLDAEVYTATELAVLYYKRWRVQLNFRRQRAEGKGGKGDTGNFPGSLRERQRGRAKGILLIFLAVCVA